MNLDYTSQRNELNASQMCSLILTFLLREKELNRFPYSPEAAGPTQRCHVLFKTCSLSVTTCSNWQGKAGSPKHIARYTQFGLQKHDETNCIEMYKLTTQECTTRTWNQIVIWNKLHREAKEQITSVSINYRRFPNEQIHKAEHRLFYNSSKLLNVGKKKKRNIPSRILCMHLQENGVTRKFNK